MIQRIQSIYLLLAAILMAATAFSPILLVGDDIVFSYGIRSAGDIIKPTWGIVFMSALGALLLLVAVFMYKNRKKQRSITSISATVILLYYITAAVYMFSYYTDFCSVFNSVAYGIGLPIIALLFIVLANRAIKKDEKLVRSLDRIR